MGGLQKPPQHPCKQIKLVLQGFALLTGRATLFAHTQWDFTSRHTTFWLISYHCEENILLHYAVVFLVIALIAAVFGFGGIAAGAVGIAKILFFVFIVLAVISFLMGLLKK